MQPGLNLFQRVGGERLVVRAVHAQEIGVTIIGGHSGYSSNLSRPLVAVTALVAAVANAGGMGFLTALTHRTPEGLREEIRKTRALTDKPFGVNLTLMPSLRPPDYPAMVRILIEEGDLEKMRDRALLKEFETYRERGLSKGFLEVVSGVFVRSSYRAEQVLQKNNVGLS